MEEFGIGLDTSCASGEGLMLGAPGALRLERVSCGPPVQQPVYQSIEFVNVALYRRIGMFELNDRTRISAWSSLRLHS